ncbi:MAG TPA: transketolase C-terminal domain-containing protein [Acidimicrobiia bacterium]|nr:transketolase C-terminal domain-containing protein [Acidimicrobiia bacterium]
MSTRLEPQRAEPSAGVVQLTYREAIGTALEHELAADPTVLLMGEDVATAGGVFKTNEGLPEKFGLERIRNTPICENGFLGVALGMSVTGLRPVVEIMFSDFLPTAADALVNELPKFRFMSGGQCTVPVTVRSIGGATGRFGTQHSATGESWYIGLPGLKVATAATPAGAYSVLRAAIRDDDPVLFFEHKGLYGRKGQVMLGDDAIARIGEAAVLREGTDVTVVSTLLMADRSVTAAEALADDGISVEVVELRWLRPLDYDAIVASVEKTGRLLVVEEQVHAGGWGATVISELVQRGVPMGRPATLSLPDDILIAYAPELEDAIIPSVEAIAGQIRSVVEG